MTADERPHSSVRFWSKQARRAYIAGPASFAATRLQVVTIIGESEAIASSKTALKLASSFGEYATSRLLSAHGTSSSLPVVFRLSMSAWAFAASASRYSPPIRTLSFPFAIQSNSCAERARNSSGVWIWSRKPA
jgi:hypothetical protein